MFKYKYCVVVAEVMLEVVVHIKIILKSQISPATLKKNIGTHFQTKQEEG